MARGTTQYNADTRKGKQETNLKLQTLQETLTKTFTVKCMALMNAKSLKKYT